MMHKRLHGFDKNRRDKLKIKSYEDYKPTRKAAARLHQVMNLLRNDPELKKDFLEAKL